eukprot:m.262209 g.262209  ORF g.262209 m.262209 type:complete len:671 (+) comp15587_c1_seq2:119-2131(+)
MSRGVDLCYVLGRQDDVGHCLGVNCLALDLHDGHILSGSRDGTIRKWQPKTMAQECLLRQHAGWVNDICLCEDINVALSCGNDGTVRIWSPKRQAQLACLNNHTDYAIALAYTPATRHFVSGGLDGSLYVWDFSQVSKVAHFADATQSASVYAVDISKSGTIIASGASDRVIRLYDPRGQAISVLKGHADLVKTVRLNEDGTKLLSGSSDNSIRVWDLRNNAPLTRYMVHTDSVWQIQPNEDFTACYSAGRDGRVMQTSLCVGPEELSTTCLVDAGAPIFGLAVDERTGAVWTATSSPQVTRWVVPEHAQHQECAPSSLAPRYTASATTPPERGHDDEAMPVIQSFSSQSQATYSVVQHALCKDGQGVIAQLSDGRVVRFDILTATEQKELSGMTFEDAVAQDRKNGLSKPPQWCSVSCSTGSITVSIRENQARVAWVLDSHGKPWNVGVAVAQSLLRTWQEHVVARAVFGTQDSIPAEELASYMDAFHARAVQHGNSHDLFESAPETFVFLLERDGAVGNVQAMFQLGLTPLSVFPALQSFCPEWCKSCLFDDVLPLQGDEAPKVTFSLRPTQFSRAPAIQNATYSCTCCYPMWRIGKFLVSTVPALLQEYRRRFGADSTLDQRVCDVVSLYYKNERINPQMEVQCVLGGNATATKINFTYSLSEESLV